MHWPTTRGCGSNIWHHALRFPITGASTAGVLGLLPQGECEKTGKFQLRAVTMVQHLECRCSEIEMEGAGLFFPREGKLRADLLEEQVQKGQIQTLLGHVRGLSKGQQAHVEDGDVQLSLFHQMLQRGDGSLEA